MPPLRLLQVSDLHMGAKEEPEVEAAIRLIVAGKDPELVVASGDLTHRNRRLEHDRAATLLRSLGPPVLAVPGNHDMPALPPARFTRTFEEFTRAWGELEPVHRSERLVVLHHHLVSAPWRTAKRPVAARTRVLSRLVDAGADLILSGHVHQSAVVERREFEVVTAEARATTVVTAPGLGRPRPHRRGEARGLHVLEANGSRLTVTTYAWSLDGFAPVAERRLPLGTGPLPS
jgi:3',5'-cyclic AMP phosphodiesterase CpdA